MAREDVDDNLKGAVEEKDLDTAAATASNFGSDTSSSVSSSKEEDRKRRRSHRKKKSSSRKERKSDKKHKKKQKKKSKKHKKRKRYDDDEDDNRNEEDSSESDEDKEDRKKKRRRRKESKKASRRNDDDDGSPLDQRISPVVQALHVLLKTKPDFASELPILLIRLAGGTTFDLRQVTDPNIASGLESLFTALETYGVKQQDRDTMGGGGVWMFQPPPGTAAAGRRDELVLLRVVRALLNDDGITMDAIVRAEQMPAPPQEKEEEDDDDDGPSADSAKPQQQTSSASVLQPIKQQTFQLLAKFQSLDSELGSQLIALCGMIVGGESVSLDGLPDANLKEALEALFDACGLEKSEMEHGDDDDDSGDEDKDEADDDKEESLLGYGLPENADESVQVKLATIMAACREGPPKRRPVGPMRQPMTQTEIEEAEALYAKKLSSKEEDAEEDEDDGPMLPGEARKSRGPTLPPDVIRAQAEYRELQLKATVAGVDMPIAGGREEWMIVPGKFDFMSNIKSGNPIKSRGFQNKKSRDDEDAAAPIHPAVQAEMDRIMQAHQDARGPSLFDQHRASLQKDKDAAAAAVGNGKKEDWKWNRDKDLDAGRRVDKDALGMILGGAADNLKTKFHGGFNR